MSTPRVCSPRVETSHATGLQHFPESLGTADSGQDKCHEPSHSPS